MTAQLAGPEARAPANAVKAIVAFPEVTRDEVFMIGTRRLWLRWARLDDAEGLACIGGDDRVAANTATWPIGATAAYARERIAKVRAANAAGTGFAFAIVRRQNWDEPIGLIGFSGLVEDNGIVATGGYHLDPDYWGQGYGSEALAGIVGMIRLLTRIRALRASVMPHNIASRRVLEKAGFVQVGEGTMTSEFRGTFPVIKFERSLRGSFGAPTQPRPAEPA